MCSVKPLNFWPFVTAATGTHTATNSSSSLACRANCCHHYPIYLKATSGACGLPECEKQQRNKKLRDHGARDTLRTHLVAAGDPVAQLIDEMLAVLAGQTVAELLVHQLLRPLDNSAGREWVVLLIVLVVDPVQISPSHITQPLLLGYGPVGH